MTGGHQKPIELWGRDQDNAEETNINKLSKHFSVVASVFYYHSQVLVEGSGQNGS